MTEFGDENTRYTLKRKIDRVSGKAPASRSEPVAGPGNYDTALWTSFQTMTRRLPGSAAVVLSIDLQRWFIAQRQQAVFGQPFALIPANDPHNTCKI